MRGTLSRPPVEKILEYRKYVTDAVLDFLKNRFGDLTDGEKKKAELILNIGINHEQQHQELLIYDIKHIFGTNPLFPSYSSDIKLSDPHYKKVQPTGEIDYKSINGGIVEIGFSSGANDFFYDNEQPPHKFYLQPYGIANRLVSNSEYLDFMNDGGYQNPLLWLSDGWDWLNRNEIDRPLYWYSRDQVSDSEVSATTKRNSRDIGKKEWLEYDLSGLNQLDLNKPVMNISYYEADAFARWAGRRLPTEQEWEAAARKLEPTSNIDSLKNGFLLDNDVIGQRYDENGNSPFAGGLWEWTGSAYLPYPGYKRDQGALGEYNGKFMSGQMVLKGGSIATPYTHYRHTYRNFYCPDKRWQFSGIRLAKDI
jgi:ergothioneine biosynthesis protein EgtB